MASFRSIRAGSLASISVVPSLTGDAGVPELGSLCWSEQGASWFRPKVCHHRSSHQPISNSPMSGFDVGSTRAGLQHAGLALSRLAFVPFPHAANLR